MWIVFVDEGQSLHNLLYTDDVNAEAESQRQQEQSDQDPTVETNGGLSVVTPSRLWSAIKLDSIQGNGEAMREILRQALLALAEIHAEGVTHRDVKPENLIVGSEDGHDTTTGGSVPRIKLADFGSANTEVVPVELWPPPFRRPSRAEETEDYSPPEVCRHSSCPCFLLYSNDHTILVFVV